MFVRKEPEVYKACYDKAVEYSFGASDNTQLDAVLIPRSDNLASWVNTLSDNRRLELGRMSCYCQKCGGDAQRARRHHWQSSICIPRR